MRRASLLALAGLLVLPLSGHTAPPWPTPEIRVIAALDIKGLVLVGLSLLLLWL